MFVCVVCVGMWWVWVGGACGVGGMGGLFMVSGNKVEHQDVADVVTT